MNVKTHRRQFIGTRLSGIILCFFCPAFFYTVISGQIPEENIASARTYSESAPYKPAATGLKTSKKQKKAGSKSVKNEMTAAVTAEKSVTVPLTVTDSRGMIVKDLQQNDFQIFVDDQEIKDFSLEKKEEALDIILVIDTSPSTAYQLSDIQNCAAAVLEDLKPQDRVMVTEFNADFKINAALTTDRQIIDKAIKKISAGDGTALYDALQRLFEQHTDAQPRRTAIVILTDGIDTMSEKSDYFKSLTAAERSGIPVFVVYVDTIEELKKPPKSPPPYPISLQSSSSYSLEEYERGKVYLNELVTLSGGRAFSLVNLTDLKSKITPKFATEMRFKYYLKFSPADAGESGIRKEIKIRIARPGLNISAKGSFITG